LKAIAARPNKRESVELLEIPRPIPSGNEVLLKVVRVGIDGTDREINEGSYGVPPESFDYLILGHEALAKIQESGPNVSGLSEGDLVVPTVRRPDDCSNCRMGESDMCLKGEYKEHGIYKLVAESGKAVHIPPFRAKILDTTGAGDAFDAGFMTGLLEHQNRSGPLGLQTPLQH